MVNVTVVSGKDTIKYLVRIVIAVLIVGVLARFFCALKGDFNNKNIAKTSEGKQKVESDFGFKALAFCIEEEIPLIGKTSEDDDEIESYKIALTQELRRFRFNY